MKTNNFSYYIILLTVISALTSSCNSVNVEKYSGDGIIHTVDAFPISYGYKIDFGKFDLSKNYREERVLQNYPKIKKDYMVGIYITSKSSTLDSDLDFHLSMKMVTFSGETLFDCSGKMSSWRWARWAGENKEIYKYFIYYMSDELESGFQLSDIPTDNPTLYLHVDYIPSELQLGTNESLTGSVQLQVGGYK